MQSTDVKATLRQAAAEVLETMCFMEIIGSDEGDAAAGDEWLFAKLNFSGHWNGQLGLSAPFPVAQAMAANLLGDDPAEVDRQRTLDTLGEIANMICGGMLGNLDKESKFDLSHPETEFAFGVCGDTVERFQTDQGPICVSTDWK